MVTTAVDVLEKGECEGENIVVVGGGLVGTETGLFLAQKGKNVTIIEMLDEILKDAATTDKIAYFEMMSKMKNIKIYVSHKVNEIRDNEVIAIDKSGNPVKIPADKVILAVGFKPNDGLYKKIKGMANEVYRVGDCISPGKIYDAIHSAYRTALKI